jgi:hypothetical protein
MEEISMKNENEKDFLDKIFDFVKNSPPLFLPVGSVRALLAFILIFVSSILMYNKIEVPDWLYSSIIMILGFYFGARTQK